jgi:hypothetical protein
MNTPPTPPSPNDPLNFKAQIAKTRQDLRKTEALADLMEQIYTDLLEQAEMEAALLRLLLRLQ